jgi:hypothetical protein
MTRWLVAVVMGLALTPAIQAQDGLRSASLPERPIATPPPGPEDLFRARPGTYLPRPRPVPPPHDGRGSGPVRPEHPISGVDGSRRWLTTGWGYWPYYSEPLDTQTTHVERDAPADGRLQLRVAPGDALVYIDGEYEGRADELREPGAQLKPGSHRVRLEATGYTSHTFDVRVDAGDAVIRRVTLDRALPGTANTPHPAPQAVKTMYVIPRCYAGDKPPDPATGCDLTQLRTIR